MNAADAVALQRAMAATTAVEALNTLIEELLTDERVEIPTRTAIINGMLAEIARIASPA